MKLVLQRVKESSVTIDGHVHGTIGKGFMVLVGFSFKIQRKLSIG